MRRQTTRALLICLLLLLLIVPGVVAEGSLDGRPGTVDQQAPDIFLPEQTPEGLADPDAWQQGSPASVICAGDAWYALYGHSQAVAVWRPGMDNIRLFAQLPRQAEGIIYADMDVAQKEIAAQGAQLLFTWHNKPYALNVYTGLYGMLTEGGVQWGQVKLDLSALIPSLEGWFELPERGFVQGDTLVLTRSGFSERTLEEQQDVLLVNLQEGSARRLNMEGVRDAAAYREGQILLLVWAQKETNSLYALDMRTLTSREMPIPLPGGDVGGMAWDAADDALYLVDTNVLYICRAGAAPARANALISPMLYLAAGFVPAQGQYALFNQGLRLRPVNPGEANSYLTVQLTMGQGSPLYRAYQRANPQARILVHQGTIQPQQIVQAMTADPTGVDLWEVSVDADYAALLDKGYALDLSGDDVLMQQLEGLYPWALQAVKNGAGAVRAVPSRLDADKWTVNKAMFEQHFPGEQLPRTWTELMNMLLRFETRADEYPDHSFISQGSYARMLQMMMESYLQQYDGEQAMDFRRPELVEALTLWQRARDMRLSKGLSLEAIDYDAYGFDSGSQEPTIFFAEAGVSAMPADPEKAGTGTGFDWVMLPPVFEKDASPMMRGCLSALVVNPQSPRAREALALLRFAANREADPLQHILLYPGDNAPVEDPDFARQLQEAKDSLDALQKSYDAAQGAEKNELGWMLSYNKELIANPEANRWQVSPNAISLYRRQAENMRVFARSRYVLAPWDNPVFRQMNSLCERYVSEQLPQEEFIRTLNDTFRLIWLERE